MKKFIIALVAVVLGLSSCSKEAKLLGSWKLDTISAKVEGVQMTISADEEELDMVLTFKDNGKVESTIDGESEGEANYTVAGNTLMLSVEDESLSLDFTVKGKLLTLSGDFSDIAGEDGVSSATITFKKL